MDSDERLNRAIKIAQQATEQDRNGNYEEAFNLYKASLEHWQICCKYQPNPLLKRKLCDKMEEYVSRAEKIKTYLNSQKSNSKPEKIPTTGNNDKSEEKDPNSKLVERLEGAILTETPNVKWTDVAGLDAAKEALQEAVILPTRFPSLFTGERKPWKGILLYGPPGTGKTHLARACATEAGATFISVSSSDLLSKWQGESEKLVKSMFEIARARAPSIVFIDEVDSLCSARSDNESESSRRIKTEFLVQMQGVGNDVKGTLILGATNVPWELDSAIRRRFERRVYIPLPDVAARKNMFELAIGKSAHQLTAADIHHLVESTEGFSGADIGVLVRDALFQAVRKCRAATHFKQVTRNNKTYFTPCSPGDKDPTKKEMTLMAIDADMLLPPDLSRSDFRAALENARPTVGPEDLKKHVKWTEQYGLEGN